MTPSPHTEGPQFSTRAESHLYRAWSGACINMSCLPEAKLAREAELAYAMICMATDYDSWHSTNESVTVEMVMGHMHANAANAQRVVGAVLDALGEEADERVRGVVRGTAWERQTRGAVSMTKTEGRNEETLRALEWLFPGYFV